jgi:c-di-GMP-related signal transduction protein
MTTEYAGNPDHPVFLGRQPILDREQRIVAYELLFRSSAGRNAALIEDDFAATSEVVVRAFTDMGLTSVLGDCLGFINVDERFLVSEIVELLPRDRVVLEVLETVEITPKVVARLSELKAMGFQLALDDYSETRPDYADALSIVDVVKVDLPLVKNGQLASVVQHLRRWPPKMLAEKVDNNEQFQICSQLGFELFQGYFFAKPTILVGRRVDPAQVGVLRLMNLVLGDVEVGAMEDEFKRYPNLTYKLLRLVNSVAFAIPTKIHSLRQALVLLGKRQVQRWLQLLLFTQQTGGAPVIRC